MSQIINLNKARKAKAKAGAKAEADQNAVKFGRTKAERMLAAAQSDKAQTSLDRHKIDPENEGT